MKITTENKVGETAYLIYMEPMQAASGGRLVLNYDALSTTEKRNWEKLGMACYNIGVRSEEAETFWYKEEGDRS